MNFFTKTNQTSAGKRKLANPVAFAFAVTGMLGAMSIVNTAEADTVYQTGFENPPFVANQSLVDQDEWVVGGTPEGPLSPDAAVISTNRPRQGKQSVLVEGSGLARQDFINSVTGGYYDAIGSYRKNVDYDTGGTQTVRVSAQVRVNGRRTTSGNNFFSASIGTRGIDSLGATFGNGELAISSDGHAYGYTGNDNVPVFLASTRVDLGEWHNLAVETNFATRKMTFFVDDECLGSFPFVPDFTSNGVRRGFLVTYAAPETAALHKANYKAKYDQFRIRTVTPEDCHRHRK